MTTFSPSVTPDAGLTENSKIRINDTRFGDGYSQRSSDGINATARDVALSWSKLTLAEADALKSFFDTQGGYLAFDYTLPNDSSSQKFICKEYNKNFEEYNNYGFSAKLEKVYDL